MQNKHDYFQGLLKMQYNEILFNLANYSLTFLME